MNDKQKLAAMGAQYRLTEEQAKALAERMPKAGVLQILDDEPLCMAKRIEELEAQVRVMAGLLREAQECVVHDVVRGMGRDVESLWARIDAALAGKLPEPASSGNVDWSRFPGWLIDHHEGDTITEEMLQFALSDMLAAAPKPEAK